MGGASGPGSVMTAPDLDPGAARLSPVHSVGVRWGLVRLFSGAAISDSSLSRRGVMARTPPDRGPGAAKTVELPRRTRRGLRDASAAQIRQHRRRRRQYRCIMSHSAAARRCRNAERRGRASFGERRPISPTEAGIVTYRHSIGD
jgi:hypothetical protein